MAGISPTDGVMAIRSAILQQNAALRDVASTGGSGGSAGIGGADMAQPGGFTQALQSALSQVSGLQGQAGDAAAAFERGDTTDIAGVMLAKQQASIGFETTLQVRNKLLSAYKDIMSMPV
ncbi:MAG: flagellar hook-basal body complex protein FliE [Sphingobium sp.]